MSHLIFTTSFLPIPQSSPVPDDEQAVRGHPANRSLSKHPSVLCGSDLITVPGPCHLCRRRPLGGHRSPSHPAAIEDYSPPLPPLLRPLFLLPRGILTFSDRLNSFTSWVVFMSFIFLSPPFFLRFFFTLTDVSADSFLSSFPSDALQGIAERKVVSIPRRRSTSAPIKQNKNAL